MRRLYQGLALVVALGLGGLAWTLHERAIGRREARIAVADSTAKAEGAAAAAWERAAHASAHIADSLAAIVRHDSALVATLTAREPRVIRVPVALTPGAPPVLTDVVSKADYDHLAAACRQQAIDASRALAAADSTHRADSLTIAALHRQHAADSVIVAGMKPHGAGFKTGLLVGIAGAAGAVWLAGRLH